VRKYLVLRFGERCYNCGWAVRHPTAGKVPLEVEHVDGNFANNRVDNLKLLCPNCHSLTTTFRALNRGKARPYRLGGRKNPHRPLSTCKDSHAERRN
jgi:ribosomal protein S27E